MAFSHLQWRVKLEAMMIRHKTTLTVCSVLALTVALLGSLSSQPFGTGQNAALAQSTLTLQLHDIYYDPKTLEIPANTDVTIELRNEGVTLHNFTVAALGISVDVAAGETGEAVVNAPAGTYEFNCEQPGHREAGMVGTLTVIDREEGTSVPTLEPITEERAAPEATISALQTEVARLQGATTTPSPEPPIAAESGQPSAAQTVNLEIILDVSGSMAQVLPSGETRMEAAKRVLQDVVAGVPDRQGVNLGLRIYGHEGDNTPAGAAVSCASSDLVVPLAGVDKDALRDQLDQLQPTGWTPIGLSLARAGEDFVSTQEPGLNYVVLVTDGLETCGADPVQAAANLSEQDPPVITSVIGFGLTPDEQATIEQIAQAGGSEVLGAADAAELSAALFAVISTPIPDIVTPTPVPRSADPGTRENPLPIGTAAEIGGGWYASVVDVVPDATELVQAENQFNEPPADGDQFFLVTISTTYEGEGSSTLPAGNAFQVVGESSVAYTSFDPGCGVIPNAYGFTEVFTGGMVEFNICFSVKSADVPTLVMYSEDFVEFDRDKRVWFALS
jgi:uncharacterized cupredoxin-like copper-binding protein/Mg-chelatase subunit ChlD